MLKRCLHRFWLWLPCHSGSLEHVDPPIDPPISVASIPPTQPSPSPLTTGPQVLPSQSPAPFPLAPIDAARCPAPEESVPSVQAVSGDKLVLHETSYTQQAKNEALVPQQLRQELGVGEGTTGEYMILIVARMQLMLRQYVANRRP